MAGPDIFLSYNREDAAMAELFADAFAREGLEVWWDQTLHSGETYDEVTEAALRGAKAVVVLWSPRSVASHWVRAEATIAHRAKTLIPATIEPCDKPVMFELTQTAELSHWQGETSDPAWRAFLGDLRRMVGRAAAEMPPLPTRDPATFAASAADGRAGVPQIGVLPFTFRGNDGELEFLAEDLTEDVTRALTETDQFVVVAAGTMAVSRGNLFDYRAIGRELGARYLAEGRLQRNDDAIRLTVQLVDTEMASAVWSHRFAAPAGEIIHASDDFALTVACELTDQLLQAETRRAMTRPAPHSAWEHVLRARAVAFRGIDSPRRSLEEARSAVGAAPDFGLARAQLAGALIATASRMGPKRDDALTREVHEHLTRALELDGTNAMVIAQVAGAYAQLGDGETSLRLARRAVELRPHLARGHHALASALFVLGRTGEAIDAYADQLRCKGYDNNRAGAYMLAGWCYLLEGRSQEADEALDKSLALNPHAPDTLVFKAVAEALLGRQKLALATMRRLREIAPDMSLEQHLAMILMNPRLARRSGEHITILRGLWDATAGDATST